MPPITKPKKITTAAKSSPPTILFSYGAAASSNRPAGLTARIDFGRTRAAYRTHICCW